MLLCTQYSSMPLGFVISTTGMVYLLPTPQTYVVLKTLGGEPVSDARRFIR